MTWVTQATMNSILGLLFQVEQVFYPGLETSKGHKYAKELFTGFGGVLSAELKGGSEASDVFQHVSFSLVHRALTLSHP